MRHISVILISLLGTLGLWGQTTNSISDGVRRIYYSDIVDAETKIIEYYEERLKKFPDGYDTDFSSALPYKMFTDLIIHDSRAFNYNFERLIDASEKDKGTRRPLRINISPDQNIKLYTWDEHGGTMTNYSGITSILHDGSITSYATSHDEISGENTVNGKIDIASGSYKIDQFTDDFSETVYIRYRTAGW